MRTLQVCIFTETYYPVIGGGETQAKLLADGLRAHGHSVIILTRRSDRSLKKVEEIDGVTVYRLPPAGRGQLKKWGLLLSGFPKLLLLRRRYDLIFVSGFRIVGVTAVLTSKLLKKKVVLKADSQGEMSGEFFADGLARFRLSNTSWLFRRFIGVRNALLKKADAFSAITNDTAVEIANAGVSGDQIHMIPNSVNTAMFYSADRRAQLELRAQLALPLDHKIAIYTGRLVSYKGLPLLVKVWHQLAQTHREILLLLVGTGGQDIHNCEAELRAFVTAHGLEESVRFTGAVTNVPHYLRAADIFAFPSENDAFPSSLIEAMICELPVVTTPVGAIDTIVAHEVNGLLVKPGDFQQLYEALNTLLTDPQLAERLGRSGRQTVQARYASQSVNEKYISLFHQLTGTR